MKGRHFAKQHCYIQQHHSGRWRNSSVLSKIMAQPLMLQREITRNASVFWGITWSLMHLKHLHSVLTHTPRARFCANTDLESAPLCCGSNTAEDVSAATKSCSFLPDFQLEPSLLKQQSLCSGRSVCQALSGSSSRTPRQIPARTQRWHLWQSSSLSRNVLTLGSPEVYLLTVSYLWLFLAFKNNFPQDSTAACAPISNPINIPLPTAVGSPG